MSTPITFTLPRATVVELSRVLEEALRCENGREAASELPGLYLPDDHPLWARHSGLIGHSDAPEWDGATDLKRAETFYRPIAGKARVLLDVLIDRGGYQLDVDQIIGLTGRTFTNSRSVAGSINGLRKSHEVSGRRYPFYWWEGDVAQYAMKPSVAELFRRARANLM